MGRALRRLTALGALALVAGCGSTPTKGLSVRVDNDPFRITVLRDGKTVVAQDTAGRLRYVLTSGTPHRLTKVISATGGTYRVATDEPGRTAIVTVQSDADGFSVGLRLKPAAGVKSVYDSFVTSADEHFLGGGEQRGQVDLRGAIVPIKVSTDCGYAPVPAFASSAGWGLALVTNNVAALAFPGSAGGTGCQFGTRPACSFPPLTDRVEVCSTGESLEEVIAVGTLPHVLRSLTVEPGPAPVPPPSELALIKWRDEVSGPKDVLEDITRFQAADIPLGWVLLDNPWETCVGSLAFDPKRFPAAGELIREVHARGVRFMLWVSPKILCNPGYPAKALLGDPADQVELDLRKPNVFAAFQAKLRKLAALGVDGVKADRGDEVDLEPISADYPNTYPALYAAAVMLSLHQGSAAIFRAATTISKEGIPGLWAGDQDGSFAGLQEAIRAGATAGISGFPVWGSDIGGYRSAGLTADVFARWARLGAVSPIMEVGGIGANATPWTLGSTAMAALKDAAILHYELFPYFYGLLQQHQPILRPLGYGFPDDPEAWKADLELLVGPDLLAAPVIGAGTTPSVYLPKGSWVDLYTGETVVGGGPSFTRPTPLTQFPLYVRAGAVLPFNLRTADSWWGTNEQTHPGRTGWLATNGAELDLKAQPHDVQIFIPGPQAPLHVTIGGRAVPFTYERGQFPGTLIRLHGPAIQGRIVVSAT